MVKVPIIDRATRVGYAEWMHGTGANVLLNLIELWSRTRRGEGIDELLG